MIIAAPPNGQRYMPQQDAPTINHFHNQPIRSFVNTMHDIVKNAFLKRKAAEATARTRRISSQRATPPSSPIPRNLSDYSSPAVPDSAWCSENFMLGAGMVILQPSTHKVVVLYETEDKYWFFPKGRKDIGESLETTALREAYEESGFKATFLPLYIGTRAPPPPDDRLKAIQKNTEPVFLSLMSWKARSARPHPHREKPGGEYLTTWYVGQIPEDAEYKPGTGMPDEQNYKPFLLSYEEAMERLDYLHRDVLRYVWEIYTQTLRVDQREQMRELQQREQRMSIKRTSQQRPQPGNQTRHRSH